MPRTSYSGSCHCGQITYTVTLDEALAPEGDGKMLVCNCSICTKNGTFILAPFLLIRERWSGLTVSQGIC